MVNFDRSQTPEAIAARQAERERLSRLAKERWAKVTPEEREARSRKGVETRRRNMEIERQQRIESQERYERNIERARRAAATRRRNLGRPDLSEMSEWQREDQLLKERRDKKRKEREAIYGPRLPTEWRKVPGGGHVLYEFPGVDPETRWKRNLVFWSYVDQSGGPDACWPWHGRYFEDRVNGGLAKYGAFYWDRSSTTGAHRAAWMLVNGFYILYPLVVDHLCSTPWCVNATPGVGHLEVVTVRENNRRKFQREPENTRQSTSSEPAWDDRWYPFRGQKP